MTVTFTSKCMFEAAAEAIRFMAGDMRVKKFIQGGRGDTLNWSLTNLAEVAGKYGFSHYEEVGEINLVYIARNEAKDGSHI